MPSPENLISPRIQQHQEDVFKLWDELSDFGVHDSDAGLRHCMERIGTWLGAQNAFWLGVVRVLKIPGQTQSDVLFGWRLRVIHPLHSQYLNSGNSKELEQVGVPFTHPGEANIALMSKAGQFRAYTLQSGELVELDSFRKTEYYDLYYRLRGVQDRIWVGMPVNEDVESFFCFDRLGENRHFDREDLELAAFALRGIKWFHRQLLLSHGLGLCIDSLTPKERRIVQGLLSGASEKAMADDLSLSQGTVHQYAIRIYRKFGVRGRAEFTALWLTSGGLKSLVYCRLES